MKLLILDGNSIFNRAFYGIKLLTTKDGRYTNAIYGFMNILLKLEDDVLPQSVAITFDLKAPTFRHKMYDGYKAQRKGMPPELAEQMPVLKELLTALGYTIITCEGYEADDIIGTLSAKCKDEDECFIATGDRDSLQLVKNNVTVLLASTKMGRPETIFYNSDKIKEDYSVVPNQLIDIKALMGDSSDNIPGVAGIGKKGAEDLITRFNSIDYIYENIETIDVKDGIRQKLIKDKEMAFLSYKLGTIYKEVPVDTNINSYIQTEGDKEKAFNILSSLEMFKIIEKLNLKGTQTTFKNVVQSNSPAEIKVKENFFESTIGQIKADKKAYFTFEFSNNNLTNLYFVNDFYITKVNIENELEAFIDVLKDETIEKYTTDSKALYNFSIDNNFLIKNLKMDISLAGYLLNPSAKDYSINRLAQEYCNVLQPVSSDDSLALDAAQIISLSTKFIAILEERNQTDLMLNIEIPLAEVLASMEHIGIKVDKSGIEQFSEKISKRIAELEILIYDLSGCEFNINSPKQLGDVLFNKLEIPTKKKTKSGFSTNAEVLEGLADEYEVVRYVLEYRTLAKLKSTYCDGLLKVIADDGRIHSSFNQTETRTGRISSTEPNLQNIPVRQELGREMRKFFIAEDGKTFIDADYSQIELRVLADIADDEVMINAFNNGDDIHRITASQVFNMPLQMVTPLMRSRAKAVNFGIVYGIGAFSLGKDIGVSRAEADKYIKDYLHHYSGVNQYMTQVVEQAKKDGYVTTLFKRRRYLPELSSSNGMLRSFGERVARNMPIQGAAADIIKIAMIRVYNRLKSENMKARLLLQVHDELIVEAPLDEAEKAAKIVSEEMENACNMKVRLKSDANIGKTWYDAKE
ncbi:MAG: DNA polymerase I [Oscillospiraceae bacterium]